MEKLFKENGIVIVFPQLDVHLNTLPHKDKLSGTSTQVEE
jgi:small-conductance mechanosensitive channel